MIEFRRNKKTGILEAYKDNKKIGDVSTMGDLVKKEKDDGRRIHDDRKQRRKGSKR